MGRCRHLFVAAALCLVLGADLAACQGGGDAPDAEPIPLGPAGLALPSAQTREVHAAFAEIARGFDPLGAAEAERGLIAWAPGGQILGPSGELIWDLDAYAFVEGDAPPTVNPSLWRQSRLTALSGLFEVAEGVYQVRGFDLANLTLIRGDTGWIVVDPLTCTETAQAALAFARAHLGDAPVTAVVYSHSHVDHFGGVLGVLGEGAREGVPILAPRGFLIEATSENMLAGQGMARRAELMYGRPLPIGPWGHVGMGLGKAPAFGTVGILPPTEPVPEDGETREIDGVPFVFLDVSGSEAPSEFAFYLPEVRALFGAELASRTMHNLYTLRGAKVRDARLWARRLDEALAAFPEAEVYLGGHLWPMWGRARIRTFLEGQGDLYRSLHDQTLGMANEGDTPKELAEALTLPEALAARAESRGYYGTASHNAKGIYQAYFGWYDGNPAHLNPLPETDAAPRYVAMMGGGDALLAKARAYYDKGEYRWVAEVVNHLVFAEPENAEARALVAASYEQLAYQAESAPWRDAYLTAARELRTGEGGPGVDLKRVRGLLRHTPLPLFLDALATRVRPPQAGDRPVSVDLTFRDLGRTYRLAIERGVLHHRPLSGTEAGPPADGALSLTLPLFLGLVSGEAGALDLLGGEGITVEGERLAIVRFFSHFRISEPGFNIVTP